MESPKTSCFVVIQTAFLGDIALTSSFLRDLRALHPQADIIFVTTALGAELFATNPWRLRLQVFAKRGSDSGPLGLWRLACALRAQRPERVYCLHRSFRSTLLAWLIGAKATYGFAEAAAAFLLQRRASRQGLAYEAEKNRAVLALADKVAQLPPAFPELYWDESARIAASHLLAGLAPKSFLAIAPSSVWATKRWPAERFAQVAAELWCEQKIATVLLGTNDAVDQACAQQFKAEFARLVPQAEALRDLTGKTPLALLLAVLSQAKVLLCNDSAPLHLAIAARTPVVAIFGSTTKELGFFPLAPAGQALVVESEALSCRPCGPHGHQQCPLLHFRCMLEISTHKVKVAVQSYLLRRP